MNNINEYLEVKRRVTFSGSLSTKLSPIPSIDHFVLIINFNLEPS